MLTVPVIFLFHLCGMESQFSEYFDSFSLEHNKVVVEVNPTYIYFRDVNECQNWYLNIRIGYSNIFEYSNDIHIYAQ